MPGSFVKYVGDTLETYNIVATDDNDNIINLTGAILSLKLENLSGQQDVVGSGNWTITDPVNGIASYQWSQSDLGTPGLYLIYTIININDGFLTLDPVMMMLQAAPS